jgi:thioredoxin-like negative regulator of GroEL
MTANNTSIKKTPTAMLLIGPGCPHCAAMLQNLEPLVKEGVIGRLTIVNVAAEPETAQAFGVRSVPWLQLGPFEFEGAQTGAELRRWAQAATAPDGVERYIDQQLNSGRLVAVERMVRKHPETLAALVPLVANPETGIQTRVGIGALLESLRDSDLPYALAEPLAILVRHDDARVRADVCHYLGLTRNPAAVATLRERAANDPDAEVREIAAESISELEAAR